MKQNITWKTKMFDVAEEKGMSLGEITKLGGYHYSKGYLSRIKNGFRSVPDSLDFQNWVAKVLGTPRETLFFVECSSNEDEIDFNSKQEAKAS